jgi:hypothetical protein
MLRPITSPIKHVMTEEEVRVEYNATRRQKQIDIFYRTGRKIHNITMDTVHMRKFRNEVRQDDKPPWNRTTRVNDDSDRGGQRWKIDIYDHNNTEAIMPYNIASNVKRELAAGYRGVMALDLTAIPPKFQPQAIERHIKDIEEYRRDQLERPERLRYENTVTRIERIHRMDKEANDKRIAAALKAQTINDNRASSGRRQYAERESHIRRVMAGTVSDTDEQTTERTSDK